MTRQNRGSHRRAHRTNMRGQRGRCQVRAKMELCPNEKADHEEQSEDGDAVFSAVHAVLKRSLGPKKWRVKEERWECSTYTTCLGRPSTDSKRNAIHFFRERSAARLAFVVEAQIFHSSLQASSRSPVVASLLWIISGRALQIILYTLLYHSLSCVQLPRCPHTTFCEEQKHQSRYWCL